MNVTLDDVLASAKSHTGKKLTLRIYEFGKKTVRNGTLDICAGIVICNGDDANGAPAMAGNFVAFGDAARAAGVTLKEGAVFEVSRGTRPCRWAGEAFGRGGGRSPGGDGTCTTCGRGAEVRR